MSERILVIDDDPDIVRFVETSLELEGYTVGTARDAEDGLQQAFADPPDLVLLDLMMPGVGGFEVLRRLQTSPA
ncbi:MAG TPA: response regulator, partial [Acidimicrobiia bacterium]